MYVVLLKFAKNKSAAPTFMEAHNTWIKKGFDEGVFLCVGSLTSGGGSIIAHGENLSKFENRVNTDPFVENGVVTAEVHQVNPNRVAPSLELLMTSDD